MCTGVVVGLSVALAGVGVCLSLCRSFLFFFFSSRRRHTRCLSDWSSDVCSSDLIAAAETAAAIGADPGDLAERLIPRIADVEPALATIHGSFHDDQVLVGDQDRKSVV